MSASPSPIVKAYCNRTPRSAVLAAAAQHVFPSGLTHDARYLDPYPIYVARASGSRKWDVDENQYVDYAGGHGALLLGHNHPAVTEAVHKQLELGTHFGACHELEIRWGEWVQMLMPSAESVRFTSSGTEATLLAFRLARAYTGRRKIIHFLGHFHGWQDHVAFGVTSHFDGSPSPGVLPGVASEMILAPPNDWPAVERLIAQHADDLAAVIVEPTGASWGQVPVSCAFLQALRQATQRHGAVLIFDEVISGFRCAPGGAQAALGITPDMTTLAKILAGGLPGGAVCGRRAIMDGLSFARSTSGKEKIWHHGTYNANPLSAAAGIATLQIVATSDACQRANDYAARLRAALRDVLDEEGVAGVVYGTYSGFHILLDPSDSTMTAETIEAGRYDYQALKLRRNPQLTHLLRLGMLVHGVDIFGWPGGPTSAVHTDADLARTADAFRCTLQMLKAEGALNGLRKPAPALA